METLFIELYERNYIKMADVRYCQAWLSALIAVGYNFPDVGNDELSCRPTLSPTIQPSNEPVLRPTDEPSTQPTLNPTDEPSKKPTSNPTIQPSNVPVISPTQEPSKQPTWSPTGAPSKQPTWSPTDEPSKYPTWSPTDEPSKHPTLSPTGEPSQSYTYDSKGFDFHSVCEEVVPAPLPGIALCINNNFYQGEIYDTLLTDFYDPFSLPVYSFCALLPVRKKLTQLS
jgi:hypothetical protein